MRILAATAAAILTASSASAQAPAPPPPAPAAAPAAAASEWRALDPANTLVIDSTKGQIIIEMRPDLAPITVARVKALTRQGYYNNALFYRVIAGFMAQTGDKGTKQYRSTLPNIKGEMTFALTPAMPYASVGATPTGDVGYIGSTPVSIATAPGAPSGTVPTTGRGHIVFCPGIAAFAHPNNAPDGGNSQFFLMRVYGQSLGREFAAFGRVVVGQDVVDALKNGEPPVGPDKMNRVRVLADIPAAQRPVVEVSNLQGERLAQLVQTISAAKGNAFSLCDIPVQARVTPA